MTIRIPTPAYAPPDAAAAAPAPVTPPPAAPAPAAAAPAAAAPAANAPGFTAAPAAKPEPVAWGDDWREKLAAGDDKALSVLKRYKTPEDWTKAGLEAQNRIRSARLTDDPMPDPEKNPEEARIWRAERGIPDAPTDYKLDAIVEAMGGEIPDAEKPLFADYMQFAHANGIGQKDLDKNLKWYAGFAKAQQEQTAASDATNAKQMDGALKADWKGDFDANMGVAKRAASEVITGADVFDARLPDGRRVGDVPDLVKTFHKMGVILFGEPVESGNDGGGVPPAGRLEQLRKEMKTNIDAFEGDPAKVAEYRNLVEWETKTKARRGE